MTDTPQTASQLLAAAASGQADGSYHLSSLRDFIASMEAKAPLSVKEYGALGDGATDDTTAIRAAITAASTGATVYFPPGTYIISAMITITTPISIELKAGAIVQLAAHSNVHMFSFQTDRVSMYGPGVLDGNVTRQDTDWTGIQMFSAHYCMVDGVEVRNCGYGQIEILNCGFNTVQNCYLHSNTALSAYGVFMNFGSVGSVNNIIKNNIIVAGGDGVWSGGSGSSSGNPPTVLSNNNIISGNQITSARIGIEVWGGSFHSSIVNNNITGVGSPFMGISLDTSNYSSVVGNVINNFGTYGIEIANSAHVAVTGNTILGTGTESGGIVIDGGIDGWSSITGNTVDNVIKGIYCSDSHTVISNNTLSNLTGNGIELNGPDHIIVTGNQLTTTGTGVIYEECSYATCSGNIINATSNGIQFTATHGTLRDYLFSTNNVVTAGINAETFTGNYFGSHIVFLEIADGSEQYNMSSGIGGFFGATGKGGGGILWEGGILELAGGTTGNNGAAMLNIRNDNNVSAQFGVLSNSQTTYKTIAANNTHIYSLHDMVFAVDLNGGEIRFVTGGGRQVAITDTASAANYLTLTGASSSAGPIVGAAGSGTNVEINLAPKGTGAVIIKGPLADQTYSKQVPVTGFSITIGNGNGILIIDPAGTLATGTVIMPAGPFDGQMVRVMSSQIVTTLTVSPNSGQSIMNAPTTIAAGSSFAYIYASGNTTWYRF